MGKERETKPLLEGQGEKAHSSIGTFLLTAVGFAIDSYDIFAISSVITILADMSDEVKEYKSTIATGLILGTIIGNIVIGALADKLGRKAGMILTMAMIFIGAVGSASSFSCSVFNLYMMLIGCRFFMGIGIGGEYPVSATYSAESTNNQSKKGRSVASTFSAQGVGALLAAIVAFTAVKLMDEKIAWRFILGIASIPCLIIFFFRLRMHESKEFEKTKKQGVSFQMRLKEAKKHYWELIGTALSWFLLDVVFYFNGLFGPTILKMFQVTSLIDTLEHNIYLAILAVPGYYVAIFIFDRVGGKRLQMIGFVLLAIVYCVLGFTYQTIQDQGLKNLFTFLYGLSYFLANAGPNATTFIIPSLIFPSKIRTTCHGISAAAGKLGALVGTYAMAAVLNEWGVPVVLKTCAVIALVGAIVTVVFVPSKPAESEHDDALSVQVSVA